MADVPVDMMAEQLVDYWAASKVDWSAVMLDKK